MEIVEFNKAFEVDAFKALIDKALYVAAPSSVKVKWRDIIAMIMMNANPTLAVKIKLWDMFCASGFMDATPDMACFTNKIMHCADIDVVRNIVYIDDVYTKWTRSSLLLSKEIINKRDSEGILDAMLKAIDNGSSIGNQVRTMINDHPQVDMRYKHLQATVEKVLYNNGQLVNSVYTITPDGNNVSIGGRRIVCGAGNGYYLDARGALRVSPKWRLVFLPDGNYAIEDASHAVVIKGDLGTISGFCGANFGIDIVKVLRDNNIEANISNNSSTGNAAIQERVQELLTARNEAAAILEEIAETVKATAGRYDEELAVAERVVKKNINAIDKLLYFYDVDGSDGKNNSAENNNDNAPSNPSDNTATTVSEGIQPLFNTIKDTENENLWIYDLLNTIASESLAKEDEDSKEYTAEGVYKGKLKDIKEGIYGVNQIEKVTEVSKAEVKCECMRMKGDVDDTYTEWRFKINPKTGEYRVTLDVKDAPDDVTNIFGIYENAKEFSKNNADKILSFIKAIKDTKLPDGESADDNKNAKDDKKGEGKDDTKGEGEINERSNATVSGDPEDDGSDFHIKVKSSGMKDLLPIITKVRINNKTVAEYNGSAVHPLITITNSDISKSKPVATVTFGADDIARITVSDSEANKGKTLGDIFNV